MKQYWMVFFLAISASAAAQTCPPTDVPDPLLQDVNRDGIDGDTSHAVFVDSAKGNDANNGRMGSPVKTIAMAITIALSSGKDVYLAKGTYFQTTSLQIKSGVNIYGQFDGWPAWGRNAANRTIISSSTDIPITVTGLNKDTRLEGLRIIRSGSSLPSASVFGILIYGNSAKLYLSHNYIEAGNAGSGSAGSNGSKGSDGGNGIAGGIGACDANAPGSGGTGGTSTCGKSGGKGGNGNYSSSNGQGGSAGGGGTGGGGGGSWGDPGGPGSNGTNGSSGGDGVNGGITSAGSFSGLQFVPGDGADGASGADGNGGGGGGGGGGQSCPFCIDGSGNGGGGGGAGGCGGIGGGGGKGGGASVPIFITGSDVVLDNNTIKAGNGGNGGNGASGGLGGAGGAGASGGSTCTAEVGGGGKGGNGGTGGAAGSGSGGAGGPSIGVQVQTGSNVFTYNNTVIVGFGGIGGTGGSNTKLGVAPSGPTGTSANIAGSTSAWSSPVPGICITDIKVTEPGTADSTCYMWVYLSESALGSVTVSYTTADSTAQSGLDYNSASGAINFGAGEVMKKFPVTILQNSNNGSNSVFKVKLSGPSGGTLLKSTGYITIDDRFTGIKTLTPGTGFGLLQNEPNPASAFTKIRYVLPTSGQAKLWITDMQGRMVKAIFNERSAAGRGEKLISLTDFQPGIYFYHLSFEGRVLSGKMVVE